MLYDRTILSISLADHSGQVVSTGLVLVGMIDDMLSLCFYLLGCRKWRPPLVSRHEHFVWGRLASGIHSPSLTVQREQCLLRLQLTPQQLSSSLHCKFHAHAHANSQDKGHFTLVSVARREDRSIISFNDNDIFNSSI